MWPCKGLCNLTSSLTLLPIVELLCNNDKMRTEMFATTGRKLLEPMWLAMGGNTKEAN